MTKQYKVDQASKGECEWVSYQLKIISHSRAVLTVLKSWVCVRLSYFESTTQINYIDSLAEREAGAWGIQIYYNTPRPMTGAAASFSLSGLFALAITYAAQISIFHFSRCITNQSKLRLFIGTPSSRRHFHMRRHTCDEQVKSSQTNQAPVASPRLDHIGGY